MRFKKYLQESTKIPETTKMSFFLDNPGGSWLQDEIKAAKRSTLGGAITAGFKNTLLIPTKLLKGVEGLQGERRKLSDERVQELRKSIEKEGIKNPIFINIQYDGTPKINEGNRRALIAKDLELKYVPVRIMYYAGGERYESPWHPDTIVKIAKRRK